MISSPYWTAERVAGLVLILGVITAFIGLMMFWVRGGQRGGAPRSRAHYVWERGLIMAAVVLTAIGFVLLAVSLQGTDAFVLANIGATAYLIGGVLVVAAEALNLTLGYEKVYGLIVIYVIMAFLAQAAIGGAWLQAGLLPVWIGWAALGWNLAWLIMIPVISRRDIYFPALHHVAPLLIGIALLGMTP